MIPVLMIAFPVLISQAVMSQDQPSEPKPQRQAPKVELEIVHVAHSDAMELAATLHPIFGRDAAIVADTHTNSVILSGPEETLDAVKAAIKELDQPAPARDAAARVTVLDVRHRAVGEVAARLKEALSAGRVAADLERSKVLLSGSSAFLLAAQELVRAIDTPQPAVQVEFAIFHATRPRDPQAKDEESFLVHYTQPVPEDLQTVVAELSRFGDVRLLARLSAAAVEREDYTLGGAVGGSVKISLSGRIQSAAENSVRMTASIQILDVRRDERQRSLFHLQTSITAPHGDTLILGTGPTGWNPGEAVILAVTVAK